MRALQKREEKRKKPGKMKEIDGVVFIKFEKEEKNQGISKGMKKAAEWAAFVLLIVFMLWAAIKVNAADPDTELPQEYRYYCEKAGQIYQICPELLEAVIEEESNGDPDAVGELGEIGLMQIYPKYHRIRAEHLKAYNLFDPEGNILVGADYLAELFEKYRDIGTVLMVYNGTENAVKRGMCGDYSAYAKKVMKRCEQLERLHEK